VHIKQAVLAMDTATEDPTTTQLETELVAPKGFAFPPVACLHGVAHELYYLHLDTS
jgi:hypothetical protein